jgi:periplasmic protein TonB
LSIDFAPADPNHRTPGHAGREYRRPLDQIFELGTTSHRRRVVSLVLAAAVAAHGGLAGAIRLRGAHIAVDLTPSYGAEELVIEREILPPPPPPEPELPAPPPREPPKVEAPVTAPAPSPVEEPQEPPASQAAQAGEILVQASDEDEEEDDEDDPYDNTFVTGHAERFAGGMTASAGSAVTAVRGPIVEKGGVPGGSGTRPVEPKAPARDRSRGAWLEGSTAWDCDFPGEADRDHVDNAVVEMTVTVRPDGTAHSVSIIEDPGHGFARMASGCALKHKFAPAYDREGKPIWGTTRTFHVGFHR